MTTESERVGASIFYESWYAKPLRLAGMPGVLTWDQLDRREQKVWTTIRNDVQALSRQMPPINPQGGE